MIGVYIEGGGGDAYSFVACPSRLTIDYASLSRRSTVPTPTTVEAPPTFWTLVGLFPYFEVYHIETFRYNSLIPFLFGRLWPQSS